MKHLLVVGLMILAVGCTEKRPMDQVFKGDLDLKPKAELCSDAEYLYLPSTIEASRTTTATRPHWMGDGKIVKLKCNENSLDVVEVESEGQFQDNPTNQLPVLSIPIRHIDYRCSQDADGRCTQKEEENTDISWKERRFVDFEPEKMKIQEVNWLPEQLTNLFYPCFTSTGERLISSSAKSDAINIILERTFQTSIACAGNIRDLKELGFSVRYHYSLVKLDTLTTPGYKPLVYEKADENKFGFFDTKTAKLDVDNNETVEGEKAFVNRWNPGRTVVYKLNKEFQKPENRFLIAHTKQAVETVNQSLAKAGTALRIEIQEGDSSLQTGDLRVNSIVLEDDPLAMGVIGYGPSAANPRTGEIVHARTVMYLGSIRKFVKATYDEFVDRKLAQKSVRKGENPSVDQEIIKKGQAAAATGQAFREVTERLAKHSHKVPGHIHAPGRTPNFDLGRLRDHTVNPLTRSISRIDFKKKPEDLIFLKNCFFTEDMIGNDPELMSIIEKMVEDNQLKHWVNLTEDQKSKALEILTPFVWNPVLVHELGHNLGLRHNFAGSEDLDNFYSSAELKELGFERLFSYSSVMDYSYSTINELPVMGKYDIAALRFGYAEKVELEDGQIVDLAIHKADPKTLKLKDYKFCTDEHVSVNPNCNVFDEGTSFTQMAEHHIRAYEESYKRNNLRSGRRHFSLMDDVGYVARLERTMGSLRRLFERYEYIKNTFGLSDTAKEWESIDFLKDLKTAVKLAANFYIKVIQTPDLMCAISEAKEPNVIKYLIPIQMVSQFAVTCFDTENIQLPAGLVMVGTAGKSFQSKKDPRSTNNYMDQIDVRGIWVDKMVALNSLLERQTGNASFDRHLDNFMDIADIAPAIDTALRRVALNQTVAAIEITTVFGQKLTVNYPVSMFSKDENMNGHRIQKPLNDQVSEYFQLPDGNPNFHEVFSKTLKTLLPSKAQKTNDSSLLNSMNILHLRPSETVDARTYATIEFGDLRLAAKGDKQLSSTAILGLRITNILEQIPEDRLVQLIELITTGADQPANLTPNEKAAWDLGAEVLVAFAQGGFESSSFFKELLLAFSKYKTE